MASCRSHSSLTTNYQPLSSRRQTYGDFPSLGGGAIDAVHDHVGPHDFLGGDRSGTALTDRVGEGLHLLFEAVYLLFGQLRRDVHEGAILVPVDLQRIELQPAAGTQEKALTE